MKAQLYVIQVYPSSYEGVLLVLIYSCFNCSETGNCLCSFRPNYANRRKVLCCTGQNCGLGLLLLEPLWRRCELLIYYLMDVKMKLQIDDAYIELRGFKVGSPKSKCIWARLCNLSKREQLCIETCTRRPKHKFEKRKRKWKLKWIIIGIYHLRICKNKHYTTPPQATSQVILTKAS